MAFLYDTTRLKPSGLACELVVPQEWLQQVGPDALQRQFARTPYAVSFRAGATTFILVTLHVLYGSSSTERIPELKAIARWMRDWADQTSDWSQNLIVLGDFNIDRQGDQLWQAFTSTGLTVPDALNKVPRTLFSNPDKPDQGAFYDQIAWFKDSTGQQQMHARLRQAGHIDFTPFLYSDQKMTRLALSHRVSDHFPLWAEFGI